MNKKIPALLILLGCMIGSAYFYLTAGNDKLSFDPACIFCNPEVPGRQKFYEDDLIMALYTHKPVFPGHCLVIPKRHVERFELLTDQEVVQIARVIRKVDRAAMKVFGTSSYLILQKNGAEVGQTVPHLHFHYIPRKQGEFSTTKFMIKMFLSAIQKPISGDEMRRATGEMKEAIESENTPENESVRDNIP